ncbi:MAG: TauD/TfdA family dioxygenase [Acidisphaera sp.]|nr:TauD/TfdA family dioxygenase [Acidisphaera sp.]
MRAGLQPIEGPAAWYGADMARNPDWIRSLDDTHRDEIAAALRQVKRAGRTPPQLAREDFPLPRTAGLLTAIARELEDGTGLVRLRGLDVASYSEDDLRLIFWGIGCHLGVPLYQNPRGEIIGEVRDETRSAAPSFTTEAPGGVRSSRARSRSSGPLRFHTDLCDVIALLCVSNAREGGVSKIASAVTIHNEIVRRRPDLAALLFEDYWRARPKDSDAPSEPRNYALPVWGLRDGKFTTQYSRTFVELAQQDPSVPRLTAAQDDALDLLAEVAEQVCLHSAFEQGDIQLLNNHVIYHGRTAYEDDNAAGRERLLLRLWLATPDSRRLPPGFDVLWGAVEPGVLRGGVVQPESGLRAPGN